MTLTGHISPNSACTNRYWKAYLATGGSGRSMPEHAAAMAHRVELEVAEGDLLHLAIGRVVFDPVLVAPEAVARVQHRRMLVGDRAPARPAGRRRARPAARNAAPAPRATRGEIEPEQIAQTPIDRIEIHAGAIRSHVPRRIVCRLGRDDIAARAIAWPCIGVPPRVCLDALRRGFLSRPPL